MTDHADASTPLTAEDLDRERLAAYVAWGEVPTPPWYWPGYAVLLGAWIASFDLGRGWRLAATFAFVAGISLLVNRLTERTGVTTPRLRGMPRALQWSFVAPIALITLTVLGAVLWYDLGDPGVPAVAVGAVAGPVVAGLGALVTQHYRTVARRLGDAAGIDR
jgi:hypothetical protein